MKSFFIVENKIKLDKFLFQAECIGVNSHLVNLHFRVEPSSDLQNFTLFLFFHVDTEIAVSVFPVPVAITKRIPSCPFAIASTVRLTAIC